MDKTQMMKRYEAETDKQSAILKFMSGGQALEQKSYPKLGPYDYNMDYIAWLEYKAKAYDRLMSGNATMKELANITSHPVAIDSDGNLFMYYNTPSIGVDSDGDGGWWDVLRKPVTLPRWFASYDGNWEDSLTLPDGWEEK